MNPDDGLLQMFTEEMQQWGPVVKDRLEAIRQSSVLEPDPQLLEAIASIRGAARVVDLGPLEGLLAELEAATMAGLPMSSRLSSALRDVGESMVRLGSESARRLVATLESLRSRLQKLLEELGPKGGPVKASDGTGELFQMECEVHTATLSDGLLILEREPHHLEVVDRLMRAAHSLKGASRVVGLEPAVTLAHAMEDVLSAARRHGHEIPTDTIELLLRGTDALAGIGLKGGIEDPDAIVRLSREIAASDAAPVEPAPEPETPSAPTEASAGRSEERVLRVNASHISALVELSGESLVESARLKPLSQAQHRLRTRQASVSDLVNDLHQALGAPTADHPVGVRIAELRSRVMECRDLLSEWEREFDVHQRRAEDLVIRIHREATVSRMRPLSDGLSRFPRMIRDLARRLGKEIDLEMAGRDIPIDRDILEKIEAPLTHLLRNAADHGLETPEEREAAGKGRRGTMRLEARHRAGTITLTLSDDGRGIDPARIRARIVDQGLLPEDEARLVEDERLYDFLFTPGFSTSDDVSEISGRGVGLDVVQNVVHEVGGAIHVASSSGEGTVFTLTLPVSRSVIRAVVVRIAGEPYAFPLARIDRLLSVPFEETRTLEDRQYVMVDERSVALIPLAQVLELDGMVGGGAELSVVVASDRSHRFGFVVEEFLGEHDLVVRPLDPRLGRVADISAASILPDGSPILILDVDDLIRSVSRLQQVARIEQVPREEGAPSSRRPRILVVDDSITVRDLERQLLESRGYEVETAADGSIAWAAVRERAFDLVITDVDMPRMDGITLCRSIKQDPRHRSLPVIIVSYRDSDADRARGREAAADLYFAKAHFKDDELVRVVAELVGTPAP